MKKWIAMLLVLTMALGLAACGNKNGGDETTTGAPEVKPASALEILETVWNSYADEDKFFAMGGDMNNLVENAPGKYSLEDEGLTATLLVPEDQIANIDQAASLVHGMMLNNFTCGAYHVTGDADAFAKVMYDTISTNPWICGTPEKLIVAVIGGEYVVAAFGIEDAMNPFEAKLTAAYPGADLKYNEAIAG
jgi:hypothetical protein